MYIISNILELTYDPEKLKYLWDGLESVHPKCHSIFILKLKIKKKKTFLFTIEWRFRSRDCLGT